MTIPTADQLSAAIAASASWPDDTLPNLEALLLTSGVPLALLPDEASRQDFVSGFALGLEVAGGK